MTLLAGQRFADRFTVVRLVGEGGMGVVYEVADGRFAGQRRALKTLRPGKESDPRSRELFAREATATATIASDHVVKVHDYDLDAAVPWVLMELLSGQSLDERVVEKGPLEWDEARRRVSELGHALGAAHRAGVLHLDLKPANLFLARQNDVEGSTRLKVLDFGLSRVVLEGKTHVLQSRAMGTEAWMPPEQFNKRAELRPSADVWPLGLIAFWMLTARHYWPSVDAQGEVDDAMALMGEVGAGLTASASERARELGVTRGLPAGFDEWFARCLVRNPGERWRDGGEASRALDEVLARASGSMPPVLENRRDVPPTRERAARTEPLLLSADRRRGAGQAEGEPNFEKKTGVAAVAPTLASTVEVNVVPPMASGPSTVGQTEEWPSGSAKPQEKIPTWALLNMGGYPLWHLWLATKRNKFPLLTLFGASVVGVALIAGFDIQKHVESPSGDDRDAPSAPDLVVAVDASAVVGGTTPRAHEPRESRDASLEPVLPGSVELVITTSVEGARVSVEPINGGPGFSCDTPCSHTVLVGEALRLYATRGSRSGSMELVPSADQAPVHIALSASVSRRGNSAGRRLNGESRSRPCGRPDPETGVLIPCF